MITDFKDREYHLNRYIQALKASKRAIYDSHLQKFYRNIAITESKNFTSEELVYIKLVYL